jgi:hypothetical protein
MEELGLIALMVAQIYKLLGITFVNSSVLFFQSPPTYQNLLWLIGSIVLFLIGYLVIVLRDERVNSIHRNFSKVFFFELKEKVFFSNRRVIVFVFAELVFAVILAASIYVYLDPELNVVPYPYNYLGFGIFVVVSYLFFSHTKEFRALIYGPTPIQKKIHEGKHELTRVTRPHKGIIRIAPRKFKQKNKFL